MPVPVPQEFKVRLLVSGLNDNATYKVSGRVEDGTGNSLPFSSDLALTARTPYGFFTATNPNQSAAILTLRVRMDLVAQTKFEEEEDSGDEA
jgi:hypothetical protein